MPRLTGPQERALLRKHLTGDFGWHTWPPIEVLLREGYLAVNEEGDVIVTQKGIDYCDANHMNIPL